MLRAFSGAAAAAPSRAMAAIGRRAPNSQGAGRAARSLMMRQANYRAVATMSGVLSSGARGEGLRSRRAGAGTLHAAPQRTFSSAAAAGSTEFLAAYDDHVRERAEQGVVPLPLNQEQVLELIEVLKAPPADADEQAKLVDLLENRIPPGVDDAARHKAAFLAAVAKGEASSPLVTRVHATKLLGTMQGGYNIQPLVDLLSDAELAEEAATCLSIPFSCLTLSTTLRNSQGGQRGRQSVMQSWADAGGSPQSLRCRKRSP